MEIEILECSFRSTTSPHPSRHAQVIVPAGVFQCTISFLPETEFNSTHKADPLGDSYHFNLEFKKTRIISTVGQIMFF